MLMANKEITITRSRIDAYITGWNDGAKRSQRDYHIERSHFLALIALVLDKYGPVMDAETRMGLEKVVVPGPP